MAGFIKNILNLLKPKGMPELPENSEFEFKDVPYPYPVKYLSYEGSNVAYVEAGEGFPILFLHGQGASLTSFTHVMSSFAEDYHVHAIDFPGFGISDKPEFLYKREFYEEFLKFVTESLGYKRYWIVGHSLGGLIGLTFAEKYPEMVAGLTLVDSGGFYDYSSAAEMMFRGAFSLKTILNTPTDLAEANYRAMTIHHNSPEVDEFMKIRSKLFKFKTKEYIEYAKTMIANLDILFSIRYHDKVLNFDFPVHLIWGEQDKMVPVSAFENAKKSIPGAHSDLIKECGHFPILERPEEFNSIAKSFIGEHAE